MCDEKWDSGLFTVEKDENSFVAIRYLHNCGIKFGNGVFYINLDSMRKDDFLNDMPLVRERPTENGYYTWIIYSRPDEEKIFVAVKVLSILEVGTIHKAIAHKVDADKIHAAGEILVDNDRLYFNLLSGTYMQNTFNRTRRRRGRCDPDELEDLIIGKMKDYLGNNITWTSQTLIKEAVLPVTQGELDLYQSYGATIQLFDSAEECIAIRNVNRGGKRKSRKFRKFRKF